MTLRFLALAALLLAPAAFAQTVQVDRLDDSAVVALAEHPAVMDDGGPFGEIIETRLYPAPSLARVQYAVRARVPAVDVTPALVRSLAEVDGLVGLVVAESSGSFADIEARFAFDAVADWAAWTETAGTALAGVEAASVSGLDTRLEVEVY